MVWPATPAANYGMISVSDAVGLILENTSALPQEHVSLQDAVGRVLAADVRAMDDLPPYRASIKVLVCPTADCCACS